MTKVKNVPDTADLTCKCNSWLEHWELFSKKKANKCSIEGCPETEDLVGAHVTGTILLNSRVYIIPLCKEHNADSWHLEIPETVKKVSADPLETCRKIKLKWTRQ